jgi:xanthine dehydrogenase YagS FAD-binding subunit
LKADSASHYIAGGGSDLLGMPKVEAMLAGRPITPELAAQAGEAAIEGARPLAKNAYEAPLTKAVVKRTIATVAV